MQTQAHGRLAVVKVCKENVTVLLTLEAIVIVLGLSFSTVDEVNLIGKVFSLLTTSYSSKT